MYKTAEFETGGFLRYISVSCAVQSSLSLLGVDMLNSLLGRSFASVLAPYANPTDEIVNALHNRDSNHALQILQHTRIQDLDLGILYDGNTLLHIACSYNAIEIVIELIILNVNVNNLSSTGTSDQSYPVEMYMNILIIFECRLYSFAYCSFARLQGFG